MCVVENRHTRQPNYQNATKTIFICFTILGNDFTGVNTESMQNYIMKSLTYEGAFAQGPDLEAHGGSTFCAVASLSLLGKLDQLDQDIKMKCVHWCSMRLLSGKKMFTYYFWQL
jgi:prenyltransferase beta subunit